MNKWEKYWEKIAQEIEAKFDWGKIPTWEESTIDEFLVNLKDTIIDTLRNDSELAKNCGVDPKSSLIDWNPMTSTTFRRIFNYKESLGQKTTRNIFAVYLGYRTAEEYLNKKVLRHTDPKKPIDNPDKPISVVVELKNADFAKEDEREEWMVYELAFLWHSKEPPGINAHFYLMTREIEATKKLLHYAVQAGQLTAREVVAEGGFTRYVTREALEEYIKKQGDERPEFLKRDRRE